MVLVRVEWLIRIHYRDGKKEKGEGGREGNPPITHPPTCVWRPQVEPLPFIILDISKRQKGHHYAGVGLLVFLFIVRLVSAGAQKRMWGSRVGGVGGGRRASACPMPGKYSRIFSVMTILSPG